MHRRHWASVIALAVSSQQPTIVASAAQASVPTMTAVRPVYGPGVDLEDTPAPSANVAIGDVNGDGHLNVVLAKDRHWPLVDRVLLGDGKGGFPTAYDLSSTPDRTYSSRLADLDRDGDLDVVVSNDLPDAKLVYLNDGKGRFDPGSAYGKPNWSTRNVSVADMDGDGFPDIAVANRSSPEKGANYVCLNRGAGRFDDNCIAFAEESATTVTPSDINGDGRLDLVVPHRDGGQSYVYVQETTGKPLSFRRVPFGPTTAEFRVSEVADFDADGRPDIVATDERTGVWLFRQEPSGAFAVGEQIPTPGTTPYALATADIDGDGRVDVIVGYINSPSVVLYNEGGGKSFTAAPFGDGKGIVMGFAIADVNGDGVLDIAAARSDATNILYLGRTRTQ